MEIILLILGLSLTFYFLTMLIKAIVTKKKLIIYVALTLFFITLSTLAYLQIPVQMPAKEERKAVSYAVSNELENKLLKINFIDNGSGGAILVQCGSKNILVDTGKANNIKSLEEAIKGHMVNKINALILTSSKEEAMGAAANIIKAYDIKDVEYLDSSIKKNSSYNKLEEATLNNKGNINKIGEVYYVDNILIKTNETKNNNQIQLYVSKALNGVKNVSFVKDDFSEDVGSIIHNVSVDSDSEDNFTVTITTYIK